MFTAKVITVSDRSFRGEREDLSGPQVAEILKEAAFDVAPTEIVPDEMEDIQKCILKSVEEGISLIVTSGGTGFAPRDVTPEATLAILEKQVPGIPEAMRAASMKITPRGCLSRGVCGIIKGSVILNLPGSPKAAKENLEAIIDPLKHGMVVLQGQPMNCAEIKD